MNKIKQPFKICLGLMILGSFSALTGCAMKPITMNADDLKRLRSDNRSITPVITHNLELKATVGSVGATLPLMFINGGDALAAQNSVGHDLAVEDHIEDPANVVLPLLVNQLKAKDSALQWRPTKIINQLEEGIDQFDSEIEDRTALGLSSTGWNLSHPSVSFLRFVLSFDVTAKLVDGLTHRTLWQATCHYKGDPDKAYSLKEFKANHAALIKLAIARGARYCAKQLASDFENKASINRK